MQKPATASLYAGNIHLTAFYNASCQVTRSLDLRAPGYSKLKPFPLQKQSILLCEVPSSWSELFPGVYFMINYIKKLNRNPIINVDNFPTRIKYLIKIRSQGVEFAHKEPV